MTQIRNLYDSDPGFPATDQHPLAERFPIVMGIFRFADCIGGAPSQAELDAAANLQQTEAARLAAIDTTIQQDAVIASIKSMTNAEYDAWWAANVTNAAQAIGVLKRVVRILCRRVL